jgi:hypothetical protein
VWHSFKGCGKSREERKESIPQRLKPNLISIVYGPTKVVP